MTVIVLATGEEAELEAFEGRSATLASPLAFPPGAPVAFTAWLEQGPTRLEGRSLGSKRRADGRFQVRMRFVNLTKRDRDALAARHSREPFAER